MEEKNQIDFDLTVTFRSSQIDVKDLSITLKAILATLGSTLSFDIMLVEQEITIKSTSDKKLNILKATIQSK